MPPQTLSGALPGAEAFLGVLSPPRKYSLTVWGHPTSLTLEPIYWRLLRSLADEYGLSLQKLVEAIDAVRVSHPHPPNLSSCLRTWVLVQYSLSKLDDARPTSRKTRTSREI